MLIDKSTQAALDNLARQTSAMVASDSHRPGLTPEDRKLVIDFADRGIGQKVSNMKSVNHFAPMRLQARYVAGSLAMVDPAASDPPFRDGSLNDIYRAQQRYMVFMQTRDQVQHPELRGAALGRGVDR